MNGIRYGHEYTHTHTHMHIRAHIDTLKSSMRATIVGMIYECPHPDIKFMPWWLVAFPFPYSSCRYRYQIAVLSAAHLFILRNSSLCTSGSIHFKLKIDCTPQIYHTHLEYNGHFIFHECCGRNKKCVSRASAVICSEKKTLNETQTLRIVIKFNFNSIEKKTSLVFHPIFLQSCVEWSWTIIH